MENQSNTSFIPKARVPTSSRKSYNWTSMLFVFSFILFLLTVFLSGGVFFYNKYLTENIQKKKEYLNKSKEAFEPKLINEIKKLDTRIKVAEKILNSHTTPLLIFRELEANTLSSVSFNSFSYENTNDGNHIVSMNGSARKFNSLALQSELFGKMDIFKNPIFSGLGLGSKGNISFKFNSEIDPGRMLFRNLNLDEENKEEETLDPDDKEKVDEEENGETNNDTTEQN